MPEEKKESPTSQTWRLLQTEDFERSLIWFQKKHPREAVALIERLDTYFGALQNCGEPQQVTGAWIHPEPHGVKALTQQGKGKALRACRLYLYPLKETKTVYLLNIGDKNSQKSDIKACSGYVASIKSKK